MIDLPNPEATIEFTIDDTAYGINGRSPCPTDYIMFLDGMDKNASMLHKLCKFDMPPPFTTSSSQAKVVFAGSIKPHRPASRVGVQVMYNMVMPATVASPNTSTTNSTSTSETQSPTETITHENTEAPDDTHPPVTTETLVDTHPPTIHLPVSIDECATDNGGCEQLCVDTAESYYCECESGYELDRDEHTCNVVCGGTLTDSTGSFQTPGWPNEYPQKDFVCEWRITQPVRKFFWFTLNTNFGIDGEAPCTTDYLQFFSGADQTSPAGGKFCSATARTGSAFVTNTDATIIFRGTKNSNRPTDRVGVRVSYRTFNV